MVRSFRSLALILALGLMGAERPGAAPQQEQTPPPAQPPASQTPAPQTPAPADQPVFRAGVNFVRVDAIVSDRDGKPILDLTEKDFEVFEDGKPQVVESFKLVQVRTTPVPGQEPPRQIRTNNDEEVEASRDDARIIAIFLDDYHVRRMNSMKVRQPLIDFIQNRLSPSDILAVMHPLTPLTEVRLTRNHASVLSAVARFDGRKYDYQPMNDIEARYAHYPANVVERIRTQITMGAIKALATRLGGLREGRKAMLIVSEGFVGRLPAQLADPVADQPGLGNPNRLNPLAGTGDTTGDFFAQTDIMRDLQDVYDVANRNNTALYTLDPRGLAGQEFGIDENVHNSTDRALLNQTMDTLRMLAENTDGRAIVNQNDLSKGLQQMLTDSATYYLLGYNSSAAPQDGKFHKIEVRVKRPRVQVRARPGYWALTAEETARAIAPPKPGPAPAVEAALGTLSATPRSSLIRTWVGMSRGENGKTKVTFVWEPMPASSGRREELARVTLLAAGAKGSPYFRGPVPGGALAPPTGGASPAAASRTAGVRGPSQVTFEAEPGKVQLLLTVEGLEAQILDKDSQEISVPDLTGTDALLATPQVFRARTAREWQALAADPKAVPTITREFSRSERLLVRFNLYSPEAIVPTARLLNRAGERMSDLQVQPAGIGGGAHQLDLALSGLAAGEYLIEISAAEKKELIAVRVGA
jgi:VWFA-related protein